MQLIRFKFFLLATLTLVSSALKAQTFVVGDYADCSIDKWGPPTKILSGDGAIKYAGAKNQNEVIVVYSDSRHTPTSVTITNLDENDTVCAAGTVDHFLRKLTVDGAGHVMLNGVENAIITNGIDVVSFSVSNVAITTVSDKPSHIHLTNVQSSATVTTGDRDDDVRIEVGSCFISGCSANNFAKIAVNTRKGDDEIVIFSQGGIPFSSNSQGILTRLAPTHTNIPSAEAHWIDAGAGNDRITIESESPQSQSFVIGNTGSDSIRIQGSESIAYASDLTTTSFDKLSSQYDPIKNFIKASDQFNARDINFYNLNTLAANSDVKNAEDLSTNYITTGDFDDYIFGSDSNDTIDAGGGNDQIYSFDGSDLIYAGDGNDLIYGGDGNDEIHSSNGQNVIYGEDGDDLLYGGNETDFIVAGYGNDEIYGQDGNDEIYGNEGNDYIKGGEGADYIEGGDGGNFLYGDGGNDSIVGGNNSERIWGGTGNDRLFGNGGSDDIYGENGDDLLEGGTGNDVMKGGKGNDELRGGDGDDELFGNENNDILRGGNGVDKLYGGTGNDFLRGDNQNDLLDGEEDTDDCYGGDGSDTLTHCEK